MDALLHGHLLLPLEHAINDERAADLGVIPNGEVAGVADDVGGGWCCQQLVEDL